MAEMVELKNGVLIIRYFDSLVNLFDKTTEESFEWFGVRLLS